MQLSNEMILELHDIRMSYANARKEVFNLLEGVNLAVEEGKVTALIGGNGAGKTTLFNIISGFLKGFKGKVMLEGHDITRLPAHRISRMGMGRLFQGRQLMEDLTLLENMKVASDDMTGESPFDSIFHPKKVKLCETAKEQKTIEVLTNIFGEGNKYLNMLNKLASELSYGEQRLIAMARLLMGNDKLLLLDEPTSGVNPRYIDNFRTIIRDMVEREGQTVLLIEHNMSFVRSVADTCHYLADGRIIKSGATADVLDDPKIRKDYLGL